MPSATAVTTVQLRDAVTDGTGDPGAGGPGAGGLTAEDVASKTIHLPSAREFARHAGQDLLESVLAPTVAFYAVLTFAGFRPALLAVLGYWFLVLVVRLARRRRLPGLILLGIVLISVRTVVAFATNNPFIYFLQPSLGNFCLAALFLLSVARRQPLTRRLADDFCAFPENVSKHPGLHNFFCRLSLLWAAVCAANGAGSLLLLSQSSIGQFLVLRPLVSYGLIIGGTAVSYVWFRRSMGREGWRVAFSWRTAQPGQPARPSTNG